MSSGSLRAHGRNINDNWLILKNGEHVLGLFQGMFEKIH